MERLIPMRALLTLRRLFFEAKAYSASSRLSWWNIFKTLLLLYYKSKFSLTKNDLAVHRINRLTVYAYDYPTLIQLYKEIFLERVYQFKAETNTPFIVDGGSNIGMSVLFFKDCYPESKIWAFEPNPYAYELLMKNISANNLKDVRAFNVTLSDVEGTADFYVSIKKGSLNGSSIKDEGISNKLIVQSNKLSNLLAGERPDFIKIDVEGDEIKIVNDLLENDILKLVRELVIEVHTMKNSRENIAQLFSNLRSMGFEAKQQIGQNFGGSTTDLIYRFRK